MIDSQRELLAMDEVELESLIRLHEAEAFRHSNELKLVKNALAEKQIIRMQAQRSKKP